MSFWDCGYGVSHYGNPTVVVTDIKPAIHLKYVKLSQTKYQLAQAILR